MYFNGTPKNVQISEKRNRNLNEASTEQRKYNFLIILEQKRQFSKSNKSKFDSLYLIAWLYHL